MNNISSFKKISNDFEAKTFLENLPDVFDHDVSREVFSNFLDLKEYNLRFNSLFYFTEAINIKYVSCERDLTFLNFNNMVCYEFFHMIFNLFSRKHKSVKFFLALIELIERIEKNPIIKKLLFVELSSVKDFDVCFFLLYKIAKEKSEFNNLDRLFSTHLKYIFNSGDFDFNKISEGLMNGFVFEMGEQFFEKLAKYNEISPFKEAFLIHFNNKN